jgi:hypothetical protein
MMVMFDGESTENERQGQEVQRRAKHASHFLSYKMASAPNDSFISPATSNKKPAFRSSMKHSRPSSRQVLGPAACHVTQMHHIHKMKIVVSYSCENISHPIQFTAHAAYTQCPPPLHSHAPNPCSPPQSPQSEWTSRSQRQASGYLETNIQKRKEVINPFNSSEGARRSEVFPNQEKITPWNV